MRGFDAAERIVSESAGVDGWAVVNDPALQRLSLCVDELLPALSRVCRVYGDGAVMHAMIAMTTSMARDEGLEETIAEAFRVNAAMLDNRSLRYAPWEQLAKGRPFSLADLGAWFHQRLHDFLISARPPMPAAQTVAASSGDQEAAIRRGQCAPMLGEATPNPHTRIVE